MRTVTELLVSSSHGDSTAAGELFARLYPEIKRVARARLAQSDGVVGLNTTALVHEGFLRMADVAGLQGQSRGQFLAYVGRVLRSVVIDFVRAESADKRGGAAGVMLTLSAAADVPALLATPTDLIAIDHALQQMQGLDNALYELLEMLTFAGTSLNEVALLRGVSRRTVERDLVKARALLTDLLGDPPATLY